MFPNNECFLIRLYMKSQVSGSFTSYLKLLKIQLADLPTMSVIQNCSDINIVDIIPSICIYSNFNLPYS